MVTRVTEICD